MQFFRMFITLTLRCYINDYFLDPHFLSGFFFWQSNERSVMSFVQSPGVDNRDTSQYWNDVHDLFVSIFRSTQKRSKYCIRQNVEGLQASTRRSRLSSSSLCQWNIGPSWKVSKWVNLTSTFSSSFTSETSDKAPRGIRHIPNGFPVPIWLISLRAINCRNRCCDTWQK